MMTQVLILALLGGINPQADLPVGKWFLGYAWRVVLFAVMGWFFVYFMLPSSATPFGGLSGPFAVLFILNIVFTGIVRMFRSEREDISSTGAWPIFVMVGVFGLLVGGRWVISWDMFNAKALHDMIGEVSTMKWSETEQEADPSRIRGVSEHQAAYKGDKVLGQDGNIGSTFKVGEFHVQDVNGRTKYVALIDYDGFWKWRATSATGTPGYIVVDGQDTSQVAKLVEYPGIKYTPNAFWGENLERHIYMSGHRDVVLTDFTFELDNQNKPWWVVTRVRPTIGWGAEEVLGVVIVDPVSGSMKDYNMDQIPDWVDRVIPDQIAHQRIAWYGEYKDGWWASTVFSSKAGLFQPTFPRGHGATVWPTWSGNEPFWFTGITSMSKDSSLTGIMQINSRTGHARIYSESGATEDAIMDRMHTSVSEKAGWMVEIPTHYMIYGQPTWIAPITANGGDFQVMAIAHADKPIKAIGKDLKDALSNYKLALQRSNEVTPAAGAKERLLTLIVSRVAFDSSEGSTVYYLWSEEFPAHAFFGRSGVSPELPFVKEGQKVSVKFSDSGEKSDKNLSLLDFDILDMPLYKLGENETKSPQ